MEDPPRLHGDRIAFEVGIDKGSGFTIRWSLVREDRALVEEFGGIETREAALIRSSGHEDQPVVEGDNFVKIARFVHFAGGVVR